MPSSSLDERPDLLSGGLGVCIQDDISDDYDSDLLEVLDCRLSSKVSGKLMERNFGDSSLVISIYP
jgi:hypothetical protein